jgi:hypothetical protein
MTDLLVREQNISGKQRYIAAVIFRSPAPDLPKPGYNRL